MTITAITQELVAEIHLSYPTLNALNLSDNEICEIENLGVLSNKIVQAPLDGVCPVPQ